MRPSSRFSKVFYPFFIKTYKVRPNTLSHYTRPNLSCPTYTQGCHKHWKTWKVRKKWPWTVSESWEMHCSALRNSPIWAILDSDQRNNKNKSHAWIVLCTVPILDIKVKVVFWKDFMIKPLSFLCINKRNTGSPRVFYHWKTQFWKYIRCVRA